MGIWPTSWMVFFHGKSHSNGMVTGGSLNFSDTTIFCPCFSDGFPHLHLHEPTNNTGEGAMAPSQEHMSTAGVPCLYAEIGKSGTGGAAYKRHGYG